MAKKKHKPKPKRTDPRADQAQNAAFLQFNPEQSTLFQMLAEAKATRRTSQAASRGASSSLVRSIGAAQPAIANAYDQNIAQIPQVTAAATQAAGQPSSNAGSALLSAIGQDAATASRNASGEKTRAMAGLEQQKVQARAGALAAQGAADTQYSSDARKITDRLVQSRLEQGAFTAKTYNELVQQAKEFGLKKATLDESIANNKQTHLDRVADRESREGSAGYQGKDGSGKGPQKFTNDKRQANRRALSSITASIEREMKRWDDNETDPKTGKRLGVEPKGGSYAQKKIQEIATAENIDKEIVQAAYEIAWKGGLKPQTRKQLKLVAGIGGLGGGKSPTIKKPNKLQKAINPYL